jgi:hypothetical protein
MVYNIGGMRIVETRLYHTRFGFPANLILTRLLSPECFGVFSLLNLRP